MYEAKMQLTDFFGRPYEETLRFSLSESEIIELEASGGLQERLSRISEESDPQEILKEFKFIVAKSYGVLSEDGRTFRKSDQISEDFFQSNAYNSFLMELMTGKRSAADFVNGIVDRMRINQLASDITAAENNARPATSDHLQKANAVEVVVDEAKTNMVDLSDLTKEQLLRHINSGGNSEGYLQ